MSYREPSPRPLRLWYVTLVYHDKGKVLMNQGWRWAKEATHAVARLSDELNEGTKVVLTDAVCGEDFAEREAEGPPG